MPTRSDERESVPCNLCGGTGCDETLTVSQRIGGTAQFRLVKCGRCGLVYLSPRPTRQRMLADSPAYQNMIRRMMRDLGRSSLGRLAIAMMRRARTPHVVPPAALLDIGCSYGTSLAYLRAAGWLVTGIELDEEAGRVAREAFGLDVLPGDAEEKLPTFQGASFDVVTMWHVLEHLFDPSCVLTEVNRVLKPGGSLILEVPNIASIWAKLMGRHWFPWEAPFHLYHFTPASLRAILRRAGFRRITLTGEPAPAETTWSFDALWSDIRQSPRREHLRWRPAQVALLYPVELILAGLGRSNHVKVVAVKES